MLLKRIILCCSLLYFTIQVQSQNLNVNAKPKAPAFDYNLLKKYPADHLILQFGYDNWIGKNDTINPNGFNYHINVQFMINKFLKANPHFSVAYGGGFGWNTASFKNTFVDIRANTTKLPFRDINDINANINRFGYFSLTTFTIYVPVELRYYSNLDNLNKSWKYAIGLKGGINVADFSKIVDPKSPTGTSLYGSKEVDIYHNSKFFNAYSLEATGRIGWGFFGVHFGYLFTDIFRSGATPGVNRYSIGLHISGL
ncbi:MAG: hypothetical protein QM539_08845 [Alphaproteobacteria bacterium]|nr:hypothetical protein [Alphaproteobacteria bacterium]